MCDALTTDAVGFVLILNKNTWVSDKAVKAKMGWKERCGDFVEVFVIFKNKTNIKS